MAEARMCDGGAALLTVHSEMPNEEHKLILGHSRKPFLPTS
jgi:hypothetical protein